MEPGEIAATIGAFFTGLGAFVVYLQLRLLNKQKKQEFTLSILKDYRDENFKICERFVKNHLTLELAGKAANDRHLSFALSGKDPISIADAITRVSYFYDFAGILVLNEAVDIDVLFSDLSDDAVICWERIKPYIDTNRRSRADNKPMLTNFSILQYQFHFDYLQQQARTRRLPRKYRSVKFSPFSIPPARELSGKDGKIFSNND